MIRQLRVAEVMVWLFIVTNLKYKTMFLVNFSKVRIHKYPKGWVVEIQKSTWYGRKYWTHLIAVSGIESEPWFYKDYDSASDEAVKYFKWCLAHGTQFYN